MNSNCSGFLKKVSVFILIAAVVAIGLMLYNTMQPIKEAEEEYEENLKDHEEYHEDYGSYLDEDDCSSCESLKETKKAIDRAKQNAWADSALDALWVALMSCLVYGVADVLENVCLVWLHVVRMDKRMDADSKKKVEEEKTSAPIRSTLGYDPERTPAWKRVETAGGRDSRSATPDSHATICTRCGTSQRAGRDYCCECGARMIKE